MNYLNIILTVLSIITAINTINGFQINHTLPLYTQQAVNCLSHLDRDIQLCQSQALEYWNISPSSSLADSCCAKWDHFECSMDVLNKSDCSDKEKQDLSEWFANVESFYANETCVNHTKHSVQCADIMMSQLPGADPTPNPPLPDPLAIDCLGHIKRDVRLECAQIAQLRWNVTPHDTPLKNICCSVWDDLDCLREIAWVRCMPVELAHTELYFNEAINWTERVACNIAPYHSEECILPFEAPPLIKDSHLGENTKKQPAESTKTPVSTAQPNTQTAQPTTDSAQTTQAKIKPTPAPIIETNELDEAAKPGPRFRLDRVFHVHEAHRESGPEYHIKHVAKLYPYSEEEHRQHTVHGFMREFRAIFPMTMFFLGLVAITLAIVIGIQYRVFRRNERQGIKGGVFMRRTHPYDVEDRQMLIRF